MRFTPRMQTISELPSGRTIGLLGLGAVVLAALGGCSSVAGDKAPVIERPVPTETPAPPPPPGSDDTGNPTPVTPTPTASEDFLDIPTGGNPECGTLKCADIGWKCGYTTDECGDVVNCADEGLECASGEVCIGGIDTPTECSAGGGGSLRAVFVPAAVRRASPTRLSGRVITPGRADDDTGNQVGVPNALVYILQNNVDTLPEIPVGIPTAAPPATAAKIKRRSSARCCSARSPTRPARSPSRNTCPSVKSSRSSSKPVSSVAPSA